jgi:hypothetical protein
VLCRTISQIQGDDAVRAGSLGAVERGIGSEVGVVIGHLGDPDGHGDVNAVRKRFRLNGRPGPFSGCERHLPVCARHDPGELVTADPGEHVSAPGLKIKPSADLGQDGISYRMAISVVDLLEAVDVDQSERSDPELRTWSVEDMNMSKPHRFSSPVSPSSVACFRSEVLAVASRIPERIRPGGPDELFASETRDAAALVVDLDDLAVDRQAVAMLHGRRIARDRSRSRRTAASRERSPVTSAVVP